jgi:hypothetical protein
MYAVATHIHLRGNEMRKSPSNTILSIPVLASSGIFVFFVLATLTLLPHHALAQHRSISIINNDHQVTSMVQEANPAAGSFPAMPTDPNLTGALAPAAQPAFFAGEIALGSGWYYLQFANGTPFGYYIHLVVMNDPNYIYHIDMGFEYFFDANDDNNGIYFYDFMSNSFFYTSPSPSFPFPFLYDFSLNTVLYYFPDPNRPGRYTSNPRYFYDFATHQVITK